MVISMARIVLNGNYNKLMNDLNLSLKEMVKIADLQINNDEVTPFKTGDTQNNVIISQKKNNVKLNYITDYSEYIYYHPELNFRKTHNSNAQGLWLENYINNSHFWENLFAISMKSKGY